MDDLGSSEVALMGLGGGELTLVDVVRTRLVTGPRGSGILDGHAPAISLHRLPEPSLEHVGERAGLVVAVLLGSVAQERAALLGRGPGDRFGRLPALDGALQQLHLRYEDLLAAGAAPDRLLHVRELASEVATRKLAGALETAEAAVRVPPQTRTSGVAADPRELPTGLEARAKANPSPAVRAGMAEVAAARGLTSPTARGLTSPTARGLTSPTARGRAELAAWARREVTGDPEAHQLLRRELSLADQLQRAGDLDGARAVLDAAAEAVRGVETHEALVANRRLGLELAHGNRTELGRALGDVRRTQKSPPPEEAFLAAQGRFLEVEAQLSLGTLDPDPTARAKRGLEMGYQGGRVEDEVALATPHRSAESQALGEAVRDDVADGPRRCWEGLAEGES